MKTCTRCKASKPMNEFPARKASRDGRHSHCRACFAEYRRMNRRLSHPDMIEGGRREFVPGQVHNRDRVRGGTRLATIMDVYSDKDGVAHCRRIEPPPSLRYSPAPDWSLVGRYRRPFDIEAILSDIAA